MKNTGWLATVKVSADGAGVVSHAGVGMLRAVADATGLTAQVTAVLADTYRGAWVHEPGRVFTDLVCAVADGADCISGIGTLGDRVQHGPVASTTTAWRLLDSKVDAAHLMGIRAARAAARERAWAAGAAPSGSWLHIDLDATICIDHSDNKEKSASTWKRTYGFHPLLAFLDRPDIAGGEALAGLLRPGNSGSNTAADHVTVLSMALAQLPADYRPDPADPVGQPGLSRPRILIRTDSAGGTHVFAGACRTAGVGFSFGVPVTAPIKHAVELLERSRGWYPAINTDGSIRDGAWVAEATGLVDLTAWPEHTRLILRKERPHPGAQLTFADHDGLRVTAFITDTAHRVIPGQLAGLELRHRQHARVEDRIRQAKASGLRGFPCHAFEANSCWLEIVMAATDLVAWTKLIGFTHDPDTARCEITAFRYRVLHTAARITRGARYHYLKLDRTWKWSATTATAWNTLRAAFT